MYVCYHYRCILQIKDVDAIVHQCNCLTVKSHGLSQKISECFPWGTSTVTAHLSEVEI